MNKILSDYNLIKRVLVETRAYRLRIVLLLLSFGIVSTLLALLAPLPLKIAVDTVLDGAPLPRILQSVVPAAALQSERGMLLVPVVLLIVIALVSQCHALASSLLRVSTAERIVMDFRAKLFRHVQQLSLVHHDSKGSADSNYRIQFDAVSLQYVILDGIMPFFLSLLRLIAMVYVTVLIDPTLAFIALAACPALYAISRSARPRLRDGWRSVKQLDSATNAVLQEVLGALRVVKAFGREDHEERRYVSRGWKSFRSRIRMTAIEGLYSLAVGMITAAGTGIVLWISIEHIRSGVLSVGDLLLVMAYVAQLYDPLKTIGTNSTRMQGHLASVERAFAILDQPVGVPERPDAIPLRRALGALRFDNVSFSYDGQHTVLKNISFDALVGTSVGIQGRTGAGKSTMMSLLPRFYDVAEGRILLDGVDIRDYNLADLRRQFGIVLQDTVLFSTTIAENIAYGRIGATEAQIVHAAKLANAHEFISKLPQGYQTMVGERGMRLSGGERQRISIARAFLKDAPILILDEPTSSIDVQTEIEILDAVRRLMLGRTTFMIAHRLSTLDLCDLRLELNEGRLVSTRSLAAHE